MVFEVEVDEEPTCRVDQREVVWAGFVEMQTAGSLNLSSIVRIYLEGRESRRSPPNAP